MQIRPYDPTAKLPNKLVLRIENLEFIEMAEMLPETIGISHPIGAGPSDAP